MYFFKSNPLGKKVFCFDKKCDHMEKVDLEATKTSAVDMLNIFEQADIFWDNFTLDPKVDQSFEISLSLYKIIFLSTSESNLSTTSIYHCVGIWWENCDKLFL